MAYRCCLISRTLFSSPWTSLESFCSIKVLIRFTKLSNEISMFLCTCCCCKKDFAFKSDYNLPSLLIKWKSSLCSFFVLKVIHAALLYASSMMRTPDYFMTFLIYLLRSTERGSNRVMLKNSRSVYVSQDTNLAPPKFKQFFKGEWRHLQVCLCAFFRLLCNIADFRVSDKLLI